MSINVDVFSAYGEGLLFYGWEVVRSWWAGFKKWLDKLLWIMLNHVN